MRYQRRSGPSHYRTINAPRRKLIVGATFGAIGGLYPPDDQRAAQLGR